MSDFKELIYKDVEFVTNRLHAPHRWDHMATRADSDELGAYVQCEVEEASAAWTVRFALDKDRAGELIDKAEEHFNDRKKHDKKMGKFELVRGYREDNENDRFVFAAKQNCKSTKSGKINKQPTVVGLDRMPLADPKWSSGSQGHIKFNMLPTFSPSDKNWGITLYVSVVIITTPSYYNNELEGFGLEPSGSYENLTDFLNGTEDADKKTSTTNDLDDEIPF